MHIPKLLVGPFSESAPSIKDLLVGYNFAYNKAKPSRFAQKVTNVTLDEDVAKIFTDSEWVNKN